MFSNINKFYPRAKCVLLFLVLAVNSAQFQILHALTQVIYYELMLPHTTNFSHSMFPLTNIRLRK